MARQKVYAGFDGVPYQRGAGVGSFTVDVMIVFDKLKVTKVLDEGTYTVQGMYYKITLWKEDQMVSFGKSEKQD